MPPISVEQLEQLRQKLSELPAYEDKQRIVSKREAVSMLAGQIDGMRSRGYPFERIVELLREGGVELSQPTLRSYLRDAVPESPAGKPAAKKRKKRRTKTEAT